MFSTTPSTFKPTCARGVSAQPQARRALSSRRHLFAKRQLLAHVCKRHFLRRGHHDCAVHAAVLQVLRDGDVLVRRARRRVDNLQSMLTHLHAASISAERVHAHATKSAARARKSSVPQSTSLRNCLISPFLRGPRQTTASFGSVSMKPMDMTPSESDTYTGDQPVLLWCTSSPSRPSMRGRLGPQMSMSRRPTCRKQGCARK
jgi:hypothetical protein